MQGLAFIVGCPRSGTSILLDLIGSHPDVIPVFEAHHLWESVVPQSDHHRITEGHATPDVIKRLHSSLKPPPGRLLVEKNPRNSLRIPFLRAVWPHAKFVHIVRDGRDTVCSLKPGIGGEDWLHAKPPSWKWMRDELSWPERGAVYWSDMLYYIENDLGPNSLTIKYEDLVSSPLAMMNRVQRFLGVNDSIVVQRACHMVSDKTSEGKHAAAQMQHYKDDHAVRVGRWRENLDADDAEHIEQMMWSHLSKYNYV